MMGGFVHWYGSILIYARFPPENSGFPMENTSNEDVRPRAGITI